MRAQHWPLSAEARSLVISICIDINGNVAPPGTTPSADAATVKAVLSVPLRALNDELLAAHPRSQAS